MGQYYTNVRLKFKGKKKEEEQLKKLLWIMNKDEMMEKDDIKLPLEVFDVVNNALLGKLKNDMPNFDLSLAPSMFASFFPNSSFEMKVNFEYSAGGGETYYVAQYDGSELSVISCQTEDDFDELSDEEQEQFEDGDLSIFDIEEILINKKEKEILIPSRNKEYEESFYKDGDLLLYLNDGEIALENNKDLIEQTTKEKYEDVDEESIKEGLLSVICDGVIPKQFQNNKEFVMKAIKLNKKALGQVSETLKNDKEVVLEAVKENGFQLYDASKELKNDKEIVFEALKQAGESVLQYTSDELKNDEDIKFELTRQEDEYINDIDYNTLDEISDDKEKMIDVLKKDGSLLRNASERLQNDRDVVLVAVKENGYALEFASDDLKNDKELVFEAINSSDEEYGSVLEYVSDDLKNNKDLVLATIKKNPCSLEFASNKIKNNKEFIMEAVKIDVLALKYASNDLQNDKEVIETVLANLNI